MIGEITADREAVVMVHLYGPDGAEGDAEVVIDTGFTGYLTLPTDVIDMLHLDFRESSYFTLADGSEVALPVYEVSLDWDNAQRTALAIAADGGPLMGMDMLYGSLVTLHVVDGGRAEITPLRF